MKGERERFIAFFLALFYFNFIGGGELLHNRLHQAPESVAIVAPWISAAPSHDGSRIDSSPALDPPADCPLCHWALFSQAILSSATTRIPLANFTLSFDTVYVFFAVSNPLERSSRAPPLA